MAIALFSVSHNRKPGSQASKIYFYINDGFKNHRVLESRKETLVALSKGEFADDYGQLLPIILPEGTHKLVRWDITNGTGLEISPRQKPSPLFFNLKAGDIKYLGNLHANLQTG